MGTEPAPPQVVPPLGFGVFGEGGQVWMQGVLSTPNLHTPRTFGVFLWRGSWSGGSAPQTFTLWGGLGGFLGRGAGVSAGRGGLSTDPLIGAGWETPPTPGTGLSSGGHHPPGGCRSPPECPPSHPRPPKCSRHPPPAPHPPSHPTTHPSARGDTPAAPPAHGVSPQPRPRSARSGR